MAGFSWRLFGILLSAYSSGLILEDFFWFVVNPKFSLRDFNSKKVKWYPWIRIGKVEFPSFYLVSLSVSILSWVLFWG